MLYWNKIVIFYIVGFSLIHFVNVSIKDDLNYIYKKKYQVMNKRKKKKAYIQKNKFQLINNFTMHSDYIKWLDLFWKILTVEH
jgi:hypothetical protein